MPAIRCTVACAGNCAIQWVARFMHDAKPIVEPVNGVLKEQRGMRRFRMKRLDKVSVEWTLASIAYNLTRMWREN